MTGMPPPLDPGLYLVATPIGNARDITLRALDILATAEVLAAEDTRSLRRLLAIHGLAADGRPVLSYHDHNGPQMRPRLLAALAEGRSVAYASDAGTPLVADPGFTLARAAIEAGHPVRTAPGASAALAALSVSGLPSDRFFFAGFAPPQAGARRSFLRDLSAVPGTVILFESPRRVGRILGELVEEWGAGRGAALCRELTKRFEEVRRGTLAELARSAIEDPPKGEVVLVIDRARPDTAQDDARGAEMEELLRDRMKTLSLREAVADVALQTGLPRRRVYQAALAIAGPS